MLTPADEQHFVTELRATLPYGVALWPSAIALAHDLHARAGARGGTLGGLRVLELGAGTGLPGIVAASLGATVVQTDRHEGALAICRRNGARNGVAGIDYRLADWTLWDDPARHDLVVGSDILYGEAMHPHLRTVLDATVAPGGRALVADPLRSSSLRLLEAMEADGWGVAFARWTIGEAGAERPIGVFELTPP